MKEKQEFMLVKITGGKYPGNYRSTWLAVKAETIGDLYGGVKRWCADNFRDWNNIDLLDYTSKQMQVALKIQVSCIEKTGYKISIKNYQYQKL